MTEHPGPDRRRTRNQARSIGQASRSVDKALRDIDALLGEAAIEDRLKPLLEPQDTKEHHLVRFNEVDADPHNFKDEDLT